MSKSRGQNESFLRKIGSLCKNQDLYAEKVAFTINGSESHKTIVGAFLSMVIAILVFGYGTDKFIVMLDREDTNY